MINQNNRLWIAFALAICMGSSSEIIAQTAFSIVSCPKICLTDKKEFNAKHSHIRAEEEYMSLVRSTFVGCKQGPVRVKASHASGAVDYYTYTLDSGVRKEEFVSLSSKGSDKDILESLDDIRHYFSDTIALCNGISIRARLQDVNLKKDGYYLVNPDDQTKLNIPSSRDTIVINPELFGAAGEYSKWMLMNKSKPEKKLATFVVHLPGQESCEDIGALSKSLRESFPEKDLAEITSYCNAMRPAHFGVIKKCDVNKFIHR